jgi:hypothetical protein
LGEAKKNGWGRVCDFVGNGFELANENGFGPVALEAKLFVCAANGFPFPTTGNGLVVCPAMGNGFAPGFIVVVA